MLDPDLVILVHGRSNGGVGRVNAKAGHVFKCKAGLGIESECYSKVIVCVKLHRWSIVWIDQHFSIVADSPVEAKRKVDDIVQEDA